ncbi:hypothetical protein GCM10009304_20510 [Pseudomonas matsuisoli]|uniref:Uncharacterized protein n=1 Tax=Pseudomonas matsuisoli TaxID=1515666 RepID=A0A917PVV8_9PSED|nr:hypothetical protein GCM10009304_20510 [Pseudomonas matsuisoli]
MSGVDVQGMIDNRWADCRKLSHSYAMRVFWCAGANKHRRPKRIAQSMTVARVKPACPGRNSPEMYVEITHATSSGRRKHVNPMLYAPGVKCFCAVPRAIKRER